MDTKKLRNSIITGAMAGVLFVGAAIAAYTVWNQTNNTTVTEPISVEWLEWLPAATYPNQEYTAKIKIDNVDVLDNGDQKVGVLPTRSAQLVRQDICWDILGDGNPATCGNFFGTKMTFTLAKDKYAEVWANVEVPSDATPGAEWVNFEVTRE